MPRRLILVAVLASFVAPAAASAAPRTVIFNLTISPLERPEHFYFQANSGPYLDGLRWTGWGSPEATGTGTYVLDCSTGGGSCGQRTDVERFPARYTVSGAISCPRVGASGRTYTKGTVEVDRPEGTTTQRFDSGEGFCEKRPARAAAVRAVARTLRDRGPARRIDVTCRIDDAISWTCRARYSQRGKRLRREFGVSPRRNAPPLVFAYGTPEALG